MAGVAQRIALAASARADRDHEPVGFDDTAVGHLDAYRPLHHHRPARDHPHDAGFGVGHGLSALITTSSSSRRPGCKPAGVVPATSPAPASTGPNGIHCWAMTSASRPSACSDFRVCRQSRRTRTAPTAWCRRRRADRAPLRTAGRAPGVRRVRRSRPKPARPPPVSLRSRRRKPCGNVRRVADDDVERVGTPSRASTIRDEPRRRRPRPARWPGHTARRAGRCRTQ